MLAVDILVLKQPFLRANILWPFYCSLLFVMLSLWRLSTVVENSFSTVKTTMLSRILLWWKDATLLDKSSWAKCQFCADNTFLQSIPYQIKCKLHPFSQLASQCCVRRLQLYNIEQEKKDSLPNSFVQVVLTEQPWHSVWIKR